MPAHPSKARPLRITRCGGLSRADFRAFGAAVTVVAPGAGSIARAALEARTELDGFDAACGPTRPDSELAVANRASGHQVALSPLLAEAVEVALRAARITDGAVDPTGCAGWQGLRYNRLWGTLHVPAGVALDLDATAGALAADRAAARASAATGAGVLVGVGPCVAAGGTPPAGGWSVHIADQRARLERPGGLATARLAAGWRSVSVTASSCVDATIAAMAAAARAEAAPAWLESVGLNARLVRADGTATLIGRWPVGRLAA